MARLIELHDKVLDPDGDGGYLSVDLIEILRLIELEGQQHTWALFDLDGMGDFISVQPAFGQDSTLQFPGRTIDGTWGERTGGEQWRST